MKRRKRYRKLKLRLRKRDRQALVALTRKGVCAARVLKRARILVMLDRGFKPPVVANAVGVVAQTARNIGWRYAGGGLHAALYDRPRPGQTPVLDKRQSQQIVALVCSKPPAGRSRWTVQLITQEAIKRRIVPKVGRETIRTLLRDHDLKPWREKNVVRAPFGS